MTHANLSLHDFENFDPHAPAGSRERRFLCPLCGESKPKNAAHRSVSLSVQTGAWRCFRCSSSGKLRDFWEERPHKDPRTRTRQLLRRTFALPSLSQPTQNEESASWRAHLRNLRPLSGTEGERYLVKRAIPLGLAHTARVRYSACWFGRPAVVFPIYDVDGCLVAAQGRYIDGFENPKTRTAGQKKRGAFLSPALWDQVSRGAPIIITEAPIDALSLAACGYPALSICGKDGWPMWLNVRSAFQRVVVAFDADEEGDAGAVRLMSAVASLGAKPSRLRPPNAKDWNEFLQRFGSEALSDILAISLLSDTSSS
jgi:hypothetical protein